jgi:hypothetical protein
MVKLVGPLHSEEARGRLGANVYGSWRGISYVKEHVDPRPEPTQHQLDWRDIWGTVGPGWKLLTNAQRNLWNDYADAHPHSDWTGKLVRMSGFNAFVKLNSWLASISQPFLTVPPIGLNPPIITGLMQFTIFTSQYIIWDIPSAGNPNQYQIQFRTAGPYSIGARPDFHYAITFVVGSFMTPMIMLNTQTEFTDHGLWGIWGRPVHTNTGVTGSWFNCDVILPDPWPPV